MNVDFRDCGFPTKKLMDDWIALAKNARIFEPSPIDREIVKHSKITFHKGGASVTAFIQGIEITFGKFRSAREAAKLLKRIKSFDVRVYPKSIGDSVTNVDGSVDITFEYTVYKNA